ncbi:hypothetical protein BDW02DRAFT_600313 [Decorospora gaudefroyi]|uniref:Uncharacterized protein n=1 Tax=Decorospora gaudefroyi TaxID=184978 RepID=A0A6A5KB67_9PLEO|nr:hypothetical protein BDW02DRAFT_600313 [Decorospora gaudefroyi]
MVTSTITVSPAVPTTTAIVQARQPSAPVWSEPANTWAPAPTNQPIVSYSYTDVPPSATTPPDPNAHSDPNERARYKIVAGTIVGVILGLALLFGLLGCCIAKYKRRVKRGTDMEMAAGLTHKTWVAPSTRNDTSGSSSPQLVDDDVFQATPVRGHEFVATSLLSRESAARVAPLQVPARAHARSPVVHFPVLQPTHWPPEEADRKRCVTWSRAKGYREV